MENSVKALYMAAGLLLGVMILSGWVYLFQKGANFAQSYDAKINTERLSAFNSQFERYARVTEQYSDASHGYGFKSKGNTASDVVSCANLAITINEQNDYDKENHVELQIFMGGGKSYNIYAEEIQSERKNFFLLPNRAKAISFNGFLQDYNKGRVVNITSSRYNSSNESVYDYYFDVDSEGIEYSQITGKIKKITFRIYETIKPENNENCWVEL